MSGDAFPVAPDHEPDPLLVAKRAELRAEADAMLAKVRAKCPLISCGASQFEYDRDPCQRAVCGLRTDEAPKWEIDNLRHPTDAELAAEVELAHADDAHRCDHDCPPVGVAGAVSTGQAMPAVRSAPTGDDDPSNGGERCLTSP